jgi:DegV family protein with EDD domain
MSPEDQQRLNIHTVPLTVHFADASYLDGVELDSHRFFDLLDSSETLPTTSQVSPQTFIDVFKGYLDAGDDVVGIFISSKLSGTYQSACIAEETLASDRLHIIDSRGASVSLSLLLSEAAKYRDAGHTAAQIAKYVAALTQKVRALMVLNTLKYVRKGGRISATTAIMGELLNMKPIITLIDGAVQSIGKARGMPAAIQAVLQKVLKELPDKRFGVAFCHACAPEVLEQAIAYMKEPLKLVDWLTCSIGSVIGTYSGRGVVGFAYIAE